METSYLRGADDVTSWEGESNEGCGDMGPYANSDVWCWGMSEKNVLK